MYVYCESQWVNQLPVCGIPGFWDFQVIAVASPESKGKTKKGYAVSSSVAGSPLFIGIIEGIWIPQTLLFSLPHNHYIDLDSMSRN